MTSLVGLDQMFEKFLRCLAIVLVVGLLTGLSAAALSYVGVFVPTTVTVAIASAVIGVLLAGQFGR